MFIIVLCKKKNKFMKKNLKLKKNFNNFIITLHYLF